MSPARPRKPSTPETLTTTTGVRVIVRPPPPPPAARPAPEVPAPFPRIVVRPARETQRDAFVRMLDREHRQFILVTCRAQGVSEESTKDVALQVLEIAGAQYVKQGFEKNGLPTNLRGWLYKLAQNEASNHRRRWKPTIAPGADADEAIAPTPDPEGEAELAERRAKFSRYLDSLPQVEAEVVLCVDVYDMTLEQTATAVQRPLSTVASQLARARGRLRELAEESARATAAGERRR